MESIVIIINQALPILLLISLGFFIRRKNFLKESTVHELQKITVSIALPAVLFTSFLNIELKLSYLVFFGFTFTLCILLFLLGRIIKKIFGIRYSYFPYLITGFEYGMLGISMFGAAYGVERIGYIAVTDLGHEIFIWFVFLPLLLVKRDGAQNAKTVIKSFLSTPVVIAIIAGLLFNISGVQKQIFSLPVTGAFMSTLKFLGNLTVPIILIIVGYGIRFERARLGEVLAVVLTRLVILIPLALLINIFVIRNMFHMEKLFEAALFTLLILPPPFIIPLYARYDLDIEEKQYINNILTTHTVISVLFFIAYFSLKGIL